MKRLILPLIAITPFLTALIPHAEAGAITADSSVLSPRLIKPGASRIARNGILPNGAIKLTRLAGASNDIQPSVGGLTLTGAGTLSLTGSSFYTGGSIRISGETAHLGASQTLGALTIGSGATILLNPSTSGLISQWSSHDPAAATQWLATPESNVNGGTLRAGISNGSIQLGGRESNTGTSPIVISNLAPAGAPVPEPGTALLLSLGALAVSQVRRRRAV